MEAMTDIQVAYLADQISISIEEKDFESAKRYADAIKKDAMNRYLKSIQE